MSKQDVAGELAYLRDMGYTHLNVVAVPAATPPVIRDAATSDAADAAASLAEIAASIASCMLCRLGKGRTRTVPGIGNAHARLMFVGEAPGRDEDLAGEPFVGRAGQLLTDIIKAMKLSREEVFIANVIKCRPPENRNPEPDELDACRPWIERQVDIIRPEVIVTLGRFALQSLLQRQVPISSVRGEWQQYRDIPLMPTYHPAYLLRNPAAKKEVWNDMKKVMSHLAIPLS
jgi:DNA polymerase